MNSKNWLFIIICFVILTLGLSQSLFIKVALASNTASTSATLADNGCEDDYPAEEEIVDEIDQETPVLDEETPDATDSASEDPHYHKKHHYHHYHKTDYSEDDTDQLDNSDEDNSTDDPGVEAPCPTTVVTPSSTSNNTSNNNLGSASSSSGGVLGASTAPTLAPTGEAEDYLMNSILVLGVLTLVYGLKQYGQKVSR